MPPLTKFQKIQQRLKTNPLNVSQPKPVVTQPITQPAPNPAVSVFPTSTKTVQRPRVQQNFGLWSAEWWPVNPTLATRDNPVIAVSTKPTPVDINTADMNSLLSEQDKINYKIAAWSFTQEDFVRGREISRKLAEQMNQPWEVQSNQYLTELERRANEVQARDTSSPLEAKRSQLQANFDTRKAYLEENARRARESTIGNIAMAGGGRSSVAQQAELDIQRELTNQLNAEQKAMDLELMAYQAELEGAKSEDLKWLYSQIDELKWQAAQSQMVLDQQRLSKIQEATSQFDSNLKLLAQKSGIQLDANDEQALAQVINIARNPDGTPNEEVIAGLPKEYQLLVRAWVSSGVGKANIPAPKVERIGWTTKSPIYGYWDGTKFVTTNAQWVPTVRSGWGWGWIWWVSGWSITQWWVWWATDLIDYNVKFKNQDQSNAFSYATRMIESSDIINQVSDDVAWMSKSEYIYQKSLGKLPYWSSLQSETIQKQEQAEQNFINAILRKESGAAIAPSEYNNAQKQYFPQPWDSAAVLEQKRKNRLTSLKWISAATGNQKALNWAINYVSQWKPATTTPTKATTTPLKTTSTGWAGRWVKK